MFGLVISFQGNMIKMHYPEISSYVKEEENWRTCKNMKTTFDNLCYGRELVTVEIAKISILHLTALYRKVLNQLWILLFGDDS